MKPSKGSGAARIYLELRERILDLALAPGEPVEEAALARLLGGSRTLVREALIRLGAEGLIEHHPNRGARVASIDLGSARAFFEALDLAQRAVTRWTALRRTPAQLDRIAAACDSFEATAESGSSAELIEANTEFHLAIAAAAANAYVERQYRLLLGEGERLARLTLAYTGTDGIGRQEHLECIMADHRAMVGAVADRDAGNAEALGQRHAQLFRSRAVTFLVHDLAADMPVL